MTIFSIIVASVAENKGGRGGRVAFKDQNLPKTTVRLISANGRGNIFNLLLVISRLFRGARRPHQQIRRTSTEMGRGTGGRGAASVFYYFFMILRERLASFWDAQCVNFICYLSASCLSLINLPRAADARNFVRSFASLTFRLASYTSPRSVAAAAH